ncbi:prolipoprotein diacylglyceryl transferase [Luteithermobacter gelatinilyticus]|uniref:prolipoprotein diacylglyceryl transferase n=1 Tax=Luteithermobacter gelatinilyticus TaxID=2582913 RepID=UPI0011070DE8|nr:prolipoprotein diacylglyceryl transferase [Luteithermobacter gelatinilyticus]
MIEVLLSSALAYPEIDPVLIEIGPLAIRWYSLAYLLGWILGWVYLLRLIRHRGAPCSAQDISDYAVWAMAGTILGGRLGYVLFYNLSYYLDHPEKILALWDGGMSFHGGFLGVALATWIFCRKHRIPFFRFTDLVACVAPIGLLLGRVANFINGELYGRVTDAPLGMVFPSGGPLPRHPSQLYEAALEGLGLLILLWALYNFTAARKKPGLLTGVFLIGYAAARTIVENFREPDAHIGFLWGTELLTMGQMLSIPMVLIGLYLVFRPQKAIL